MSDNFIDIYTKKNAENAQATPPPPVQNSSPKPTPPPPSGNMNYTQQSNFKTTNKPSHAKKSGSKLPLIYVIIGVLAVIITIVIIFAMNKGIDVPNMVGWQESDVKLWTNEKGLMLRTENVYSDEIAVGEVVFQTPLSGEEIKGGEFIEITVSAGPDYSIMVEVPNIMEMTMNQVEKWAKDNLMKTVRILTAESATVENGKVIEFTVNDNTVFENEIRRDTPLYVVFSKGVGTGDAIEVPNFLTMSLEEAQAFATEKKIVLELEEVFHETYPKGQIISQDIKAEQKVFEGNTIKLTVSKGKEIIVPNFASYSKELGMAIASQLGITTIVKEEYSGYSKDSVIYQSIASGTLYNEGDIVELVYSLGNSFLLSSFVGQTEDGIKSWADSLNEQGASIKISTTYTTSDQPIGTILSQNKSNTNIGVRETISIIVSKGKIVYMPDFIKPSGNSYANIIKREDVIATCEALDIVPVFVEQKAEGRLPGEVWYQSIAAGTEINQRTSVEIRYCPIASYSVPNFVGMTKAEIETSTFAKQFSISYEIGDYKQNMDGKITAQSILTGTTVAGGTAITVYICGDKPPVQATPEPTMEPTPTPEPVTTPEPIPTEPITIEPEPVVKQ